jgi:hypothetical protein
MHRRWRDVWGRDRRIAEGRLSASPLGGRALAATKVRFSGRIARITLVVRHGGNDEPRASIRCAKQGARRSVALVRLFGNGTTYSPIAEHAGSAELLREVEDQAAAREGGPARRERSLCRSQWPRRPQRCKYVAVSVTMCTWLCDWRAAPHRTAERRAQAVSWASH